MNEADPIEVEDRAYHAILAGKIFRVRRESGLSQAEVGELIGVAQPHVGRWELGKGQPRPAQLHRFVREMRRYHPWLTADWLIDPEAIEPAGTSDPDEQIVQLLVRDLGPIEARRRLLGVGFTFVKEDRPPQVVKPIRSITRRAEDLPRTDPPSEKYSGDAPPFKPDVVVSAGEQWAKERRRKSSPASPGPRKPSTPEGD